MEVRRVLLYGMQSRETMKADELMLSKGRPMFPLIPHRSLLGVIHTPFEQLESGDVVVVNDNGVRKVRRLLRIDHQGGSLHCRADYNGRVSRFDRTSYVGTVAWRCHEGWKRSLVMRNVPFMKRLLPTAANRIAVACLYEREEEALRTEDLQFLLESVRASECPGGQTPAPPQGMDWDACLDLALTHRICGLVAKTWTETDPPDRILRMLEEDARTAMAVHQDAMTCLNAIVPALRKRGISCLVLKGPSVSNSYYRTPAERPFTDLDILVSPDQRDAALAVLEQDGFRLEGTARTAGMLRRIHFHFVLKPPPPLQTTVEMHWQLVDRANLYRLDVAEVFSGSREIEVAGVKVQTLGLLDELIYTCIHICKHGSMNRLVPDGKVGIDWIVQGCSGNRLIWLVDLRRLLVAHAGDIGPVQLWERAKRWNVVDEVRECLLILQELLPSQEGLAHLRQAPGGLTEMPLASKQNRPARRLRWWMHTHPELTLRPVRLLGLGRLLFPSPYRMRAYYGPLSFPGLILHYVVHPVHMMGRMLNFQSPFATPAGDRRLEK